MIIQELFEGSDDWDHSRKLQQTGFWGSKAAGCIFLAKDTGKLMLVHRSEAVQEPGTWGSVGGAIDSKEDPVEALKREIHEETGFEGHVEVEPLYVFKKGTFSYYNFLVIVDHEFTPELDWENQGFVWCTLDTLPSPLHFGLVSLFKDAHSMNIIQKTIDKYNHE